MGRGRPTKYNDQVAATICRRLALGQTLIQICRQPGMPTQQSIHNWLNEKPDFFEQYTRAREKQADALAEECLHIANKTKGKTKGEIAAARLQIDTRKWFAGKLKGKWSDKTRIEHTGADGKPIKTEAEVTAKKEVQMSDIELIERARSEDKEGK